MHMLWGSPFSLKYLKYDSDFKNREKRNDKNCLAF